MQVRHGTRAYRELSKYIKEARLVPLAHTQGAGTEEFTQSTSRMVYAGRTKSRLYHIYRDKDSYEGDLYLQIVHGEPQESLWFKIERKDFVYADAVGENCQSVLSPFKWSLLVKYFKEVNQNVKQQG